MTDLHQNAQLFYTLVAELMNSSENELTQREQAAVLEIKFLRRIQGSLSRQIAMLKQVHAELLAEIEEYDEEHND